MPHLHPRVLSATILACLLALSAPALADAGASAPPLGALAKMPVTEVTIFKDGHALMLHAGKMPTDPDGNVVLDYLPAPVLGTFWCASNEKSARLTAVTASQHRVAVTRTALTIRELLEANVGANVRIKEIPDGAGTAAPATQPGPEYVGKIVALPERSVEELEATSPVNTAPRLPQKGSVLILKTDAGSRVIDLARIQEVMFSDDHKPAHTEEELRNLMTLKLQWENKKPQPQADVSMMYLQKGIRWIPSYKITIDGNGTATVQLQATLINELYDLNDVSAHLVVGVPTFAFADHTDPIALQQALAPLSQYFRANDRTGNQFSNGIMSQIASNSSANYPVETAPPALDLGPEVGGAQRNEDLFIFNLNHLTLKKGDRLVVPINEFKLPYTDVYKLDLPFTPPPEVWRQFQTPQQSEIARLAAAPKFMHLLRLTNKSDTPLTTAPALIVSGDRVLAQTMMTYTPASAQVDVALTQAIDILLKKTDTETKRTNKAEHWDNADFVKIDLAGAIHITNHRNTKAELEITRNLLGQADTADNDGKIEMLNSFEDHSFAPSAPEQESPYWWGWYNWPTWWTHFNGIGRITWKTTLDPDKSLDLNYTWHYYWR